TSLSRLEAIWNNLSKPVLLCNGARRANLAAWLANSRRALVLEEARQGPLPKAVHKAAPEDLALLMPTSGSTGAPKLVMLSHWNLVARSLASIQVNRFTAD